MTDVIRPANGQTAAAQSARNAWQDPHSTAGYDGASGERNLMAPESGEASAWPNRPGAASPAGWLLPADGEAAPPFRHGMEPVRSDDTPAGSGADDVDANGDDHDGAWYTDPQPTSLQPVGALWPWSFQNGSRHIPVVGPTEALRGRAGGPGMAVPPGAVPGLLDPHQRSGWQLAQQVWQESGVVWELPGTESHGAEFPGTDFAKTEPAALRPADMKSARPWFDDADPTGPDYAGPEYAGPEYAGPEYAAPELAGPRLAGPEFADSELRKN